MPLKKPIIFHAKLKYLNFPLFDTYEVLYIISFSNCLNFCASLYYHYFENLTSLLLSQMKTYFTYSPGALFEAMPCFQRLILLLT